MPQHPATYLQIDLQALVHNYTFFKSKLNTNTKLMAVVKAFAYGHEAVAIAKRLEQEGVAHFAVAYTAEGVALRKAGITSTILVLHPQIQEAYECITYQLEPNIYSFRMLAVFSKAIAVSKENLAIHLKFNTGLNRLGFSKEDISKLMALIKQNKQLKIASVFSHLVASEDPAEKEFTLSQIQLFKEIIAKMERAIPYPFSKHLSNTSGVLNYPEAHFDRVRVGIGLYGYANDKSITKKLKNVASLYSVISQIHTIQKGESVGYNRGFIAEKETLCATIPIGHADGIPRTWGSGVGFVFVNGKKAPILGFVCMDMIMVNVTAIDCQEGDAVVVFDSKENLLELANTSGTISYEVLTAISQRVPRVLVG